MITEKRVLELRDQAYNGYVDDWDGDTHDEIAKICDLALRALEGEKREVGMRETLERIEGELRRMGLSPTPPALYMIHEMRDWVQTALRSSPVDRAQGECKRCSGSGIVGEYDQMTNLPSGLSQCEACNGTGRTPATEVAKGGVVISRDLAERLVAALDRYSYRNDNKACVEALRAALGEP